MNGLIGLAPPVMSSHPTLHGTSRARSKDRGYRVFGTFAPETVPARYGLAGGKRVAGPVQALAGGYPALLAGVRAPTRNLIAG